MRFLIFGAGVLGSLYGARLCRAGHDVTLLARGERAVHVRCHGIVLQDALKGTRTVTPIKVAEEIDSGDRFDAIVVLVRKNQLAGALPVLAAHTATPTIVFMVNTASGYAELLDAVGPARVLVGFAGAGGTMHDGVVEFTVAPRLLQRTTFGEPSGAITPRLRQVAQAFTNAGFPVALECDMDAWQKTHVAWVAPVAEAIYAAGGDMRRLARTRAAIVLMLRAIRESFAALRALGVPITPTKLGALAHISEPVALRLLPPMLGSRRAEIILGRHANAARDEMAQLDRELRSLAGRTAVATPHLDALARYIDESVTPLAVGTRQTLTGTPRVA